jgi:hypothetical protein
MQYKHTEKGNCIVSKKKKKGNCKFFIQVVLLQPRQLRQPEKTALARSNGGTPGASLSLHQSSIVITLQG